MGAKGVFPGGGQAVKPESKKRPSGSPKNTGDGKPPPSKESAARSAKDSKPAKGARTEAERPPDVPSPILAVRNHLMTFLGAPSGIVELKGNQAQSTLLKLEIGVFTPGGKDGPVLMATCGASLVPMNDGRRLEGILIAKRAPPKERAGALHALLAGFATYAEKNNVALGVGAVIPAAKELSPLCNMTAMALFPPLPVKEDFWHLAHPEHQVEFVWLVPLYEAEAEFCLEKGPGKLHKLFAEQGTDLADLQRDPVSLDGNPAASSARPSLIKGRQAAEAPPQPHEKPPLVTPKTRGKSTKS
jgi:hypothetical protein